MEIYLLQKAASSLSPRGASALSYQYSQIRYAWDASARVQQQAEAGSDRRKIRLQLSHMVSRKARTIFTIVSPGQENVRCLL